mgnify:FL=1
MAGGRQRGAAQTLGRAELALAYELYQEGYRRRLIARALGTTEHYLNARIRQCEREGIYWIKDR